MAARIHASRYHLLGLLGTKVRKSTVMSEVASPGRTDSLETWHPDNPSEISPQRWREPPTLPARTVSPRAAALTEAGT